MRRISAFSRVLTQYWMGVFGGLGLRNLVSNFHARRVIYTRDLLHELVARDIKVRYKRSILGLLWSLVSPLAQFLVLSFLFALVLPLNVPRYSSFVLSGLLVWSWFATSLSMAAGAITENRELIRQPAFPSVILPVVTVATNLVHFLLALPVLAVFLMRDGSLLTSALLALPLLMVLQFVLTVSLAYVVAAFHVTFRDTQHLVTLLLMLVFYLTPVFYEVTAVPAEYRGLYDLNPMVHVISAYRAVLLQGQLPDLPSMLALGALASALLWLGHTTFVRASHRFAEEL